MDRRWRTVGEKLGLPSTANITGSLKKNYEKFLFPFELHLTGQKPSTASASSTANTTPAMSPPPSASSMDSGIMQQQQQAANRLLAQQQQLALHMAKQATTSKQVMSHMMHPGFMSSPGMNLPTNMMPSSAMNHPSMAMSNPPMNMVNPSINMMNQSMSLNNPPMNMVNPTLTSQGMNMMNPSMATPSMQPAATLPSSAQPIPSIPSSSLQAQPVSVKQDSVPSIALEEKEPDPKKPGFTPMKRIPGMVFNPNTRELEAETWAGFPVDMVEKVLGPLFDIVTTTVFPKEIIRM